MFFLTETQISPKTFINRLLFLGYGLNTSCRGYEVVCAYLRLDLSSTPFLRRSSSKTSSEDCQKIQNREF